MWVIFTFPDPDPADQSQCGSGSTALAGPKYKDLFDLDSHGFFYVHYGLKIKEIPEEEKKTVTSSLNMWKNRMGPVVAREVFFLPPHVAIPQQAYGQ